MAVGNDRFFAPGSDVDQQPAGPHQDRPTDVLSSGLHHRSTDAPDSRPDDHLTATDVTSPDPADAATRRRLGASLTLPNLLLLLFAVGAAATGQLMLKHGMSGVAEQVNRDGGSLLLRAATAPWVIGGLAVFGISALAWLTTLSRVPLSVAYPFNAIGLLIVVGSSVVVLHEKVSPLGWAGVAAVVGGLILVVVAQSGQ